MTYISGFYCDGGIVLASDKQETFGDQKSDAETKLYAEEGCPLALGGAGFGDAVEAFAQELISRAKNEQPSTIAELKACIAAALKENHEKDAATSDWPTLYRKAQYLIAAKPKDADFVLFRVQGKRIFQVKRYAIIGAPTPTNVALLRRMYRDGLPMQQAVMLAIYAVSQSKEIDAYVGGDVQIAIVVGHAACLDDPEYIRESEARIKQFLRYIDALFLSSIDVSISPTDFRAKLEEFGRSITAMREEYLRYSAASFLKRALYDPSYRGEPYSKIFPGAIVTWNKDASDVDAREETAEEIAIKEKLFEAFESNPRDEEYVKELMKEHEQILAKYRKPGEIGMRWQGKPKTV